MLSQGSVCRGVPIFVVGLGLQRWFRFCVVLGFGGGGGGGERTAASGAAVSDSLHQLLLLRSTTKRCLTSRICVSMLCSWLQQLRAEYRGFQDPAGFRTLSSVGHEVTRV